MTTFERIGTNRSDTWWDGDRGKFFAIREFVYHFISMAYVLNDRKVKS